VGPWSRPTLARRPFSGQLAASPTSSPLGESPRQVSISHDKSPPRKRSPAPAGTWDQTRSARTGTDVCGGTILHDMQVQQRAAMQAAHLNKSLNAGLTGCATITSPSSPTATRKLSPRHSSTLYDAHKPRLRLKHGNLGKYSGRLRQVQTTQGR
jgi:hypothetical protein